MISAAYERAKTILREHQEQHKQVAELLIEKEVIFSDDLERILGKRPWDEDEDNQSKEESTETESVIENNRDGE